jgi:hypothetical protein
MFNFRKSDDRTILREEQLEMVEKRIIHAVFRPAHHRPSYWIHNN